MSQRPLFATLRRILIPAAYGCEVKEALAVAAALGGETVVAGFIRIGPEESLSAGAGQASELRRTLRPLAGESVRIRARVRVSHMPWTEVLEVVEAEDPDLLVLNWPGHLEALGVEAADALARPPCDLALIRGPFPETVRKVLVPVRGGPHAELALRLGLSLRPEQLTVLHLTHAGDEKREAPFQSIERVVRRMPEVEVRYRATDDPAGAILEEAAGYDLVLMGSATQGERGSAPLGAVADGVLHACPVGVIVVKTRRRMPMPASEAAVSNQAISILVDKWFAETTYSASEFSDLEALLRLKREQGLTISLALPALNEEETIGRVIRTVKRQLLERLPLLDEIVVVDSDSSDRTREIAAGLGVPAYVHQELLPRLGARPGKGEALWKSLLVTRGDIIAWIDTDIVNIDPRFVYGILGPLLLRPRIQLVKGFYRRPLRVGGRVQAGAGGRATELTARPLLNLFYPELSGIIQPLSGEYAGRRQALERLPFCSGYGVETGLLIDVLEAYGLSAIAQVDLLERVHHNQPLEALSKMSFAIIQAVIRRIERRYGAAILEDVNKSMKLIRYEAGGYYLEVEEIVERERPPMIEVAEYQEVRQARGGQARASSDADGR